MKAIKEPVQRTPKVLSCKIEDDLSGVLIVLDSPTQFAGPVPCSKFMDVSLLGANTVCSWARSTLFLSCPANDWLLMAGDSLSFLTGEHP
jgi:hypothetical protein